MKILYLWLVTFCVFYEECKNDELLETKLQKYGCYGIHSGNVFMDASCPSNDNRIAVSSIYAGAKKKSTGCERATTGFNFTFEDEERCCKPDSTEDCTFLLNVDGGFNENYKYHINCTGKTRCDKVRTVSMDSPSNCSGEHWETSNYLYMDYFCVPGSKIGEASFSVLESLSSRASLYIWNKNYPNPSPVSTATVTCSVETECGSTISAIAIDVRLVRDTSDVCQQSLIFLDNTTSQAVDCSHNSFHIGQVFKSTRNYMTMEFINNYNSTGGYFWIGFSTTGNGCGSLKVNCPAIESINTCGENASMVSSCETTVTTPATTVTEMTTEVTSSSSLPVSTAEVTSSSSLPVTTADENTTEGTTTTTTTMATTITTTTTTTPLSTENTSSDMNTTSLSPTSSTEDKTTSASTQTATLTDVETQSILGNLTTTPSDATNAAITMELDVTSGIVPTSLTSATVKDDAFPWWIFIIVIIIIIIVIGVVILLIRWKKKAQKISPSDQGRDAVETDINADDQKIENENEHPLDSLLKTRRRSSVHFNPSLPYLDAIVDANVLIASRKLAPIDFTPTVENPECKKRKKKKKKKTLSKVDDNTNTSMTVEEEDKEVITDRTKTILCDEEKNL